MLLFLLSKSTVTLALFKYLRKFSAINQLVNEVEVVFSFQDVVELNNIRMLNIFVF